LTEGDVAQRLYAIMILVSLRPMPAESNKNELHKHCFLAAKG
jgi:hypothetical protein